MDFPKSGTETALDACDYFVDDVIEVTRGLGITICHITEIFIFCVNLM